MRLYLLYLYHNGLDKIPEIKRKIKNVMCMTVCETETVHEDYGKLFKLFR